MVDTLRQAGFQAAAGYPGQVFAGLSQPLAAVSIQNADSAGPTMTILVEVASPANLGGAACQQTALEITQILYQMGAVCSQGACSYSGSIWAYIVPIQAVFSWSLA